MFLACCHCGNDYNNRVREKGSTETIVCSKCEYTTIYTLDVDNKTVTVKVFDPYGKPYMSDEAMKRGVSLKKPEQSSKTDEIKADESAEETDIDGILKNRALRESLYSTFKCKCCGEKLKAISDTTLGGNRIITFYCGMCDSAQFSMSIDEVCAVLNFNPLV